MIAAEQVDYQMPPDAAFDWVETWLFPVVVPEAGINVMIYVAARPALGTVANQIVIGGSLTDTKAELLHYYDHQHLPLPKTFSDFTLPSGLTLKATKPPREFRIDYVGKDGTEIHVDWIGLMDPFDIHDPNHSPQAGRAEDMHADIDAGAKHQAGHFDMTGRATGTLTVRGKTFKIDCVERMDHSWGPRDPTVIKNMYIVSATFDENLAFHMICPWNPDAPHGQQFQLTHGYVLDHGKVYGLTSNAKMTSVQHGLVCSSVTMQVEDIRGKVYDMVATVDVGFPWTPYPSALTHNTLMTWHMDGRVGYGVVLANYNLGYLNQKMGRFLADPSPKVFV